MPKTGRLRLILVDVNNKVIRDRVAIRLQHRVLSNRHSMDVDARGPLIIDGLRCSPQGMYILKVRPQSYRPHAVLVNVKGPTTTLTLKLHIKPNRAEPAFPAFATLKKLNGDLADVLERSSNVKGHRGETGAALWTALPPLHKAAVLNISTKAFAAPLRRGQGILPLVTLRKVLQDRCFTDIPKKLVDEVEGAATTAFEKVDGSLHDPPQSYEAHGSYKTRDRYGNLQFTFFHAPARDAYAADIDIDNSSGIRHAVDVVKHALTNGATHPYDIHEILVEHQGLDPGYTLAPKRPV